MGAIPHDWNVGKLKYVAPEQRLTAQGKYQYIGLENIEGGTGRLINYSNGDESNSLLARKGDVLFGKLRPYLSKSLLVKEDASCSGEFIIMRPRKIRADFLTYITLDPSFVKQIDVSTYGTKMPRANWDYIGNLLIPIPNAAEQKEIVSYLNSRCAQIDEAIYRHRKAIDKLDDYWRVIVSKAVTKGLDSQVPLRDSGYAWIGSIPSHWKVMKLSFFSTSVLGKMLDQRQETGINVHRYLSNKDVQWFRINTEELSEMSFPENSHARYGLQRNDILICEGGEVGRCGIWEKNNSNIYFQKALHRLRVLQNIALPKFIAYQIYQKACSNNFIEVRKGEATIAHLPGDQLKKLKFVLPPLHEQNEIVTYLDRQYAAVNEAIGRQRRIINKLIEYRQSLIHVAVTGRIDCTKEPL